MLPSETELALGERRPCVLIAEDDARFREVLVERFRGEGYDVIEVGDGRTLLALMEARLSSASDPGIDVVVCDQRMPAMSGLEALRYLRGWDRRVPFVLISAFCDDEVRLTADAWGADRVLSKPFELDRLVDVVARVL